MQDYEISPEILREEPHGRVHKGLHIPTDTLVLIKKVPAVPNGVPPSLSREILFFNIMLQHSPSAYVIRRQNMLSGVEDGRVIFYSIFEYLDIDLGSFIAASVKPLPSDLVRRLLFQLLRGVDHCHDCRILHRNLSPKNLLLDPARRSLKIGDDVSRSFGCFDDVSRFFNFVGEAEQPGTVNRSYQAPEVLLRSNNCWTPADVWAVGCIFAEMVSGDVLFVGYSDDPKEADRQQLYEIFRQLGKPTLDHWPGLAKLPDWKTYQEWEGPKMKARDYVEGELPKQMATVYLEQSGTELLTEMLTFDPHKRITAKAALIHPYFDGMLV